MKAPPFQPGNNLGGRPRGARNRLSKEFLEDLTADWEANGAAAIRIARKENPTKYCLMVASLVPKELEITSNVAAELPDEELTELINAFRQRLQEKVIDAITVDPEPLPLMIESSDASH